MPLVEYTPDPRRYDGVFVVQTGYGPLVRYRGSNAQYGAGFPQLLKSLFSKIAGFVTPILKSAALHSVLRLVLLNHTFKTPLPTLSRRPGEEL
jgi:hypothetical protein